MMYKTNAPDKIKGYIDEAARLMASGRVVSVDPTKTESDGYMPIAEAVDTYKQLYMNDYFEAVRNNAGIASLMIRSVRLTGDPADWLKDQERIEMLDSPAVRNAFDTYFMNGAFLWSRSGIRPCSTRSIPARSIQYTERRSTGDGRAGRAFPILSGAASATVIERWSASSIIAPRRRKSSASAANIWSRMDWRASCV